MEKTTSWAVLIILLSGILLFFYWFGLRPNSIKKKCFEDPYSQIMKLSANEVGKTSVDAQENLAERKYIECLRKNGL